MGGVDSTDMGQPYVKWAEEETSDASGPPGDAGQPARRARAAWLVRDVRGAFGEHQEVLAYLGPRPEITASLREELVALYPDVTFDWDELRRAVGAAAVTDVRTLTDDELALRLRQLAQERGLSPLELSLRLGYTQRQVLPELLALLEREGNVARLERTSGSVFEYLAASHLDYAFLVYKARLFFQEETEALDDAIRSEPSGFGDVAWRERRAFWRARLDAYRSGGTGSSGS
jgi:hypothetical protein